MEQAADQIEIRLTREEAVDLFTRCLRSHDEDTETSLSILKKLATKLKYDSAVTNFECPASLAA